MNAQLVLILAFIAGIVAVSVMARVVASMLPTILLSTPAWGDLIINSPELVVQALSGNRTAVKEVFSYVNPLLYWDKLAKRNPTVSIVVVVAYTVFTAYTLSRRLGSWALSWFLASVIVWVLGGTLKNTASAFNLEPVVLLLALNIPTAVLLLLKR